ncbi:replication-relaxation family protein [Sulfobacillus harzensis]|uniref:Uncharacterized protein n=1 Tax=Sulfobacillus harzensis TaxID=2729629 RepID=A0A7Y0Q177_9FIRM|nr:replication-relaxation family protein [Sulfobacillus harzensis]NMP21035.1 hypothetical protein [Sulfobacillus harzensis]
MDNDWRNVLETTGYLSLEQLSHWYGLKPEHIMLEPWMLLYKNALWDARRFHGGRQIAHWALRTRIFYALAPHLTDWQAEVPDNGVRPDALLQMAQRTELIALEVDTGKENQQQWREKLARYHSAPSDWHLWVVAQGGRLRLTRLRTWLGEWAPLAWALSPMTELTSPLALIFQPPRAYNRMPSTIRPRMRRYFLQQHELLPERAAWELSQGTLELAWIDRRHEADWWHLRAPAQKKGARWKATPPYDMET